MAGISLGIRMVRAMRRVPTRFPADQWPGEPLMETGERFTCALCNREADCCDRDPDVPTWCLDCGIQMERALFGQTEDQAGAA